MQLLDAFFAYHNQSKERGQNALQSEQKRITSIMIPSNKSADGEKKTIPLSVFVERHIPDGVQFYGKSPRSCVSAGSALWHCRIPSKKDNNYIVIYNNRMVLWG
jgi:hypothetical protein